MSPNQIKSEIVAKLFKMVDCCNTGRWNILAGEVKGLILALTGERFEGDIGHAPDILRAIAVPFRNSGTDVFIPDETMIELGLEHLINCKD